MFAKQPDFQMSHIYSLSKWYITVCIKSGFQAGSLSVWTVPGFYFFIFKGRTVITLRVHLSVSRG